MNRKEYKFLAVFTYHEDSYGKLKKIDINFPEFNYDQTFSVLTEEKVYEMAEGALGLILFTHEQDKKEFPERLRFKDIKLKDNQLLTLIKVNLDTLLSQESDKLVRKNVAIPKWLNDLAIKNNLNFSNILKLGLMDWLEVNCGGIEYLVGIMCSDFSAKYIHHEEYMEEQEKYSEGDYSLSLKKGSKRIDSRSCIFEMYKQFPSVIKKIAADRAEEFYWHSREDLVIKKNP